MNETDLVNIPNSKGENILLFLAQTVGRQSAEQRQYRPARSRTTGMASSRKVLTAELEPDMPEHDLEPPRFARLALERLLSDWPTVKSMLLSGYKEEATPQGGTNTLSEDQLYLQSQGGTTLLDKFTHCLMVKCSVEMLDGLLTTLITEMENKAWWGRQQEARLAARRFIRSVVRVFVVFSVEIAPLSGKKKNSTVTTPNTAQPLMKCKRAFQALISLAIEELCEAADALIVPVRLGVARPTVPFPLVTTNADAIHGSDELFSVDPLQPLTPRAADEEQADASGSLAASSSLHLGGGGSGSGASGRGRSAAQRMESEDLDAIEGDEGEADGDPEADNSEHEDGDGNVRGGGGGGRDGTGAGGESDMELDLLAETESESDDNEHDHEHDNDNQSTHTQV